MRNPALDATVGAASASATHAIVLELGHDGMVLKICLTNDYIASEVIAGGSQLPGLDKNTVREINWAKATQNIIVDTRTDFILAPHLDIIFRKKSAELIQQLSASLGSGPFNLLAGSTIH